MVEANLLLVFSLLALASAHCVNSDFVDILLGVSVVVWWLVALPPIPSKPALPVHFMISGTWIVLCAPRAHSAAGACRSHLPVCRRCGACRGQLDLDVLGRTLHGIAVMTKFTKRRSLPVRHRFVVSYLLYVRYCVMSCSW